MNNQKVYTAPSAEYLLLMPKEHVALGEWAFGSDNSAWFNRYKPSEETGAASALGIINGGKGLSASSEDWGDGFTFKQ